MRTYIPTRTTKNKVTVVHNGLPVYQQKNSFEIFHTMFVSLLERIFRIFFSEMNEFYLITFHWPKYIIKQELIKTNFLEQLSKCSHLSFTIERGQWWGEGKGVKMSLDTRVESLTRVVLDHPRTISKAIISMQDGNSLIM